MNITVSLFRPDIPRSRAVLPSTLKPIFFGSKAEGSRFIKPGGNYNPIGSLNLLKAFSDKQLL